MRFSMRPDRVYDGYEQIRGEELTRRGVRLLLCDLDYTLAPSPSASRTRGCAAGCVS